MKFAKYIIFALILVLLDQGFKLWVHGSMAYGETIHVFGDWFKLHYILNPGIAFGLTPDFAYGKFCTGGEFECGHLVSLRFCSLTW